MNYYTHAEAMEASTQYFNGNDLAASVFVDKYALRDNDNNILEKTPADMHRRFAREFARIEKSKFNNPLSEEQIFEYFDQCARLIPQGSPSYGIGNPFQCISISNCFVIEPPQDSYASIMKTDEQLVQIAKRRGGTGTDISHLRPDKTPTHNAARTSTGIIPFMERFSNSTREVGQNNRRGANMITLSVHHPQILDFINSKADLSKITGSNISTRLTDEFLHSVDNDTQYQLRWPVDTDQPKISSMIPARDVWQSIIHAAHASAEPGILFWDNIIKESPADCYTDFGYKTVSTNPCVTSDTWVMTSQGPRRVSDLIDKTTKVIVNGSMYNTTSNGFFSNGRKVVYEITTVRGYSIRCTGDHLLYALADHDGYIPSYTFKKAAELIRGDRIQLQNHTSLRGWKDRNKPSTATEGWLVGLCVNQPVGDNSEVCVAQWDRHYKRVVYPTYLDKSNNIQDAVEKASSEFYKGFMRGLFGSYATITDSGGGCSNISITMNNLLNARAVQRMLLRLGIVSERNVSSNQIVIKDFNTIRFGQVIGFNDALEPLNTYIGSVYQNHITVKHEEFCDEIKSISLLYAEDVYDCTVDIVSQFDANGITAHNCSELPLSFGDSCRLLLLNLFYYVVNPFKPDAYIDFNLLYNDAIIAQRLMDDMVDLECENIERIIQKIQQDPEDEETKSRELLLWQKMLQTCREGRRTGTGITALGDTLAAIGIEYGSAASIATTEAIYKTIKLGCYRSSVDMAKELGAFKHFNTDLEKDNPFLLRIKEEDKELWQEMQQYGRRNIALLTTSPAGSVSILAKLINHHGSSSGIEPQFSIMPYIRRRKINPNDTNVRVDFVDQSGDKWQEYEVFMGAVQDWMEVTGETDLGKSPWSKACANDIDWINRVKLQAAAQRHVDHSISSTVNLPENVTEDTVSQIFMTAWKSGCKGITVYRDKCRSGVLINKEDKTKLVTERPKEVECDVYHIKVAHKGEDGQWQSEEYFVLVGLINNKPYEVFAGKNGCIDKNIKKAKIVKVRSKYRIIFDGHAEDINDINTFVTETEEGLTRLTSLLLRSNVAIHEVVKQLEKVDGDLQSFAKSLARALKKYIPDGTKEGEKCPDCHSELVRECGCVICKNCGWSKCL
ncbi:MAG: LAGLIDADG family homing endonuclease [Clostridia bacterium]|jgi:ribonucleotide reductase alpha subunit